MPQVYERIVLTGGNGMLAHALRDLLDRRGLRYHAFDSRQCDITNESNVAAVFDQHRPTLLLNCAAFTKVDQCEQEPARADAINGHAVGTLAQQCRRHGTVLMHVSTDFVFDGRSSRAYRPDDPPNPLSAYGRSKLLGEQKLQDHAPARWLIVRTAWVYGRHGANFPRTMVTAARAGKPLTVVNDQIGSPTYTLDLGDAILRLIDCGAAGIHHMTNSGQTSWFDFARAILDEFHITADIRPITSAEWTALRPASAARPAFSVLDTSRYEQATGHRPRPWRDALQDFNHLVEQHGF